MKDFTQLSCREFVADLSSDTPTPGGGGASALAGAIGMALGNMVGSLTVGKKKYDAVQADILDLKQKADTLQSVLLRLASEDAVAFEPLSRAYSLPAATTAEKQCKQAVLERALFDACTVPLAIMESCGQCLLLHRELAQKGSTIALSDVGVGTVLCKAALMGASLNVFINTKAMKDRTSAEKLNEQANLLLETYTVIADELYLNILTRLK